MKAAVLTGIREMGIIDMSMPMIKNDSDVLIKIKMVGICGSDIHYYETGRIGSQVVKYPYLVGHECAGVVEAVGKGVKNLKPGDKIAVDPAVSCNSCDQCNSGRANTCRNLSFLGTPGQGDGCLCEYIVMPHASCFLMPETMSFEQGVLCEPFAISYYAVQRSLLKSGQSVLILGTGPIGLGCLAAAKAEGAGKIYATEKITQRMQVALNAGAVWAGNPDAEDIVKTVCAKEPLGIDIAYECAGQQETIDQAVELLKPGGKLMLVGIPREARITFEIDKIRRKEITIINIRRQNGCTEKVIDMISSGMVDLDFMITHKFELACAKESFDLVANYNDGVIKAFIEM